MPVNLLLSTFWWVVWLPLATTFAACRCLLRAGASRRATCSLCSPGHRRGAREPDGSCPAGQPAAPSVPSLSMRSSLHVASAPRTKTQGMQAAQLVGCCCRACAMCCACGAVRAVCRPLVSIHQAIASGHAAADCVCVWAGGIPSYCVSWFRCEGQAAALSTRSAERWSLSPIAGISLLRDFLSCVPVSVALLPRRSLLQNKTTQPAAQ